MTKQFVVDDSIADLLERLAKEEDKTPEQLITELVKRTDEAKHIVWQPGKGHVRVRCGARNCFETHERESGWRD